MSNTNNTKTQVDLNALVARLDALETENKALKNAQVEQQEELKKVGFTANDLVGLSKQVLGIKDNNFNKNKITFKQMTYIKDGLPQQEDVVAILAPHRKGVEVVQKITLDLVIKMGNYAESFAKFFAQKAQEHPDLVDLTYSDAVKNILISRGIFNKRQLKNMKPAYLSNLITPVHGQDIYLKVLKETQKDLRV